MKSTKEANQAESFHKSPGVSSKEKNISHPKEPQKQKRKRNSCPLSYVEVITYAILDSPRGQRTLSEIYSFIQERFPEFTENRARWKNTVRHNLSLHECFQRGQVAYEKGGCYWQIHPRFLADFIRGDFSKRKIPQPQYLFVNGEYSYRSVPELVFPFRLSGQSSPFEPHIGMLHSPSWNMRPPYGQLGHFFWTLWVPRKPWIYREKQTNIPQKNEDVNLSYKQNIALSTELFVMHTSRCIPW